MSKPAPPRFSDDTPEARAFRLEQAFVDAEIEGIARDPEAEALLHQLEEDGVSDEERIRRLTAYVKSRFSKTLAAE